MDHLSETNQILNEIVTDLYNSSIKSCTIFKVTRGLSDSNPDAYKPQLVSIGPYHNNNPQLRSMENYKLRYLQRFLRRKAGIDVERCIRELEMLKDEALKCYDDIEYSDHNTGQFLKILLLDGCFVVEFIRESFGLKPDGEEEIIEVGCIYNQVVRDMLLLENQLPFFVLTKLHCMTMAMDQRPFIQMVKETFDSSLLKMHPSSFIETEGDARRNIKHLLQLVHMSCQPLENKASQTGDSNLEGKYCCKRLCWGPFKKIRLINTISEDKGHQTWDANMPNATDLYEAGVRFSKVEKNNYTSLFDIKFENGLITIPYFEVFDFTETILRNLIAYEQLSFDVRPRYFSDFSIFMDYLIDSDKDVSLLHQKGIIKNEIGEDKEVASFFNKIGKGVSISPDDFYYKEECRKAVQHCKKPWNIMKASLRHNYLSSPWIGASTVGAIILLILTFIQTVLAFRGGVK